MQMSGTIKNAIQTWSLHAGAAESFQEEFLYSVRDMLKEVPHAKSKMTPLQMLAGERLSVDHPPITGCNA